jgi:hypothetical protein
MPRPSGCPVIVQGGKVDRIVTTPFLGITVARELIRIPSGARICVEAPEDERFVRIRLSQQFLRVFGEDLEYFSQADSECDRS